MFTVHDPLFASKMVPHPRSEKLCLEGRVERSRKPRDTPKSPSLTESELVTMKLQTPEVVVVAVSRCVVSVDVVMVRT